MADAKLRIILDAQDNMSAKIKAAEANLAKLNKVAAEKQAVADKAAVAAEKAQSKLGETFRRTVGAIGLTTIAYKAISATISESVRAAEEANRVNAVTSATIKATGRAMFITTGQIEDLALAESRLTSIDDEVIQSGTNMLLTFRGIGEDVLPRATRAMEDMAVAMAGGDTSAIDLKSTAIQLGKALNDPLVGMTALQRVGITFSAQQKAQVKYFMEINDLASAQGIILSELENEFGGLSAAMGETAAGGVQKLKNEWGNLLELMGQSIVGGRGNIVDFLSGRLVNINDTLRMTQQLKDLMATGKITEKQGIGAMQMMQYGDASKAIQYIEQYYSTLTEMADAGSNTLMMNWVSTTTDLLVDQELQLQQTEAAWGAYQGALDTFKDLQSQQDQYLKTTGNEMGKLLDSLDLGLEKTKLGYQAVDDALGTTLVKELEHQVALEELAKAYKETGDADALREGLENLSEVELKDLNSEMKEAAASVEQLYAYWAALQGMPTTLRWEVIIDGVPDWLGAGGGGGGKSSNKLGAGTSTNVEAASGADFIVPPGYPNDSYTMGVTSGEHVSVTPKGQGGKNYFRLFGPISFNVNGNVSEADLMSQLRV